MEYEKRDRYRRILGKVLVSGQDMNLEQVKAGLVRYYKKYKDEQTTANRVKYSDAEREAWVLMFRNETWRVVHPV